MRARAHKESQRRSAKDIDTVQAALGGIEVLREGREALEERIREMEESLHLRGANALAQR